MSIAFDPTLYHGRPADETGRLPRETAVYDLLERLAIPFVRVDHAPAATIDDCGGIDALLGTPMCKNLFLCNRQKTAFYLLLLPGHKPLHTRNLSAQLGVARLSFADTAYMEQFLTIAPGAVSVMGLMNDHDHRVQLVLDRPVAEARWLGCHPCVNTSSLRLATADLLERFLPAVGHAPVLVDLPEEGAL